MTLTTDSIPAPRQASAHLSPGLDQPIETILQERFDIKPTQIAEICQQFGIIEFGIFGSVLRDDFRESGDDPSDVDILLVFEPDHKATWKEWLALDEALQQLFHRKIDIIEKQLLENPYRRAEILRTNQIIYERKQHQSGLDLGHDSIHPGNPTVHERDI